MNTIDDFYELDNLAKQQLANRLKVTDWLGEEVFDNHPLPHIDELIADIKDWVSYSAERCYQDLDSAIAEFEKSTTAWVKAGAIAHLIKLKKLYLVVNDIADEKIKSFQEFCERIFKRSRWTVDRLIESSYIVLALARKGFTILPQNEFQASKLVKFAKKFIPKKPDEYYDFDRIGDDELFIKWQEVIDKIPSHELSATRIAEIVDSVPPKQNFNLGKNTKLKAINSAAMRGMTPDEYINYLVDKDRLELQETIEEPQQPEETTEIKSTEGDATPRRINRFPSIFSSLYSQPTKSLTSSHDSRSLAVPFGDDGWSNSS